MSILTLDIATKCGWCYNKGDTWDAGTWELATPREIRTWNSQRITRRLDPRVLRLAEKLQTSFSEDPPDVVVFEDVPFSVYTYQVQLWSALRSSVWLTLGRVPDTIFECVNPTTLKRFATGSGSAKKEQMMEKLWHVHPELKARGFDDNAVDAIWLWKWAVKNLARTGKLT
jgi:Holliday junction resolvasome RuvABC endonuclease subunit